MGLRELTIRLENSVAGCIPGSGDLRVVLVQLLKVLERIPHASRLLLGRRCGLRNVDGHNGRLQPTRQPGFSTMLSACLPGCPANKQCRGEESKLK